MENINDSYFDGHYKEIWRSIIPEQLTIREVDFMISYFDLKPGSKVLDIMCGFGRHAIALARRDIEVTAVDNLNDYITEINKVAKDHHLPIKPVKANIAVYKPDETFDLSICMGNSLNFFNEEQTIKILTNIAIALKPNGHLLINSWSLEEIVNLKGNNNAETQVGDLKFINESKQLTNPSRIETKSTIITPKGETEMKIAIDYIFSISQIESMLKKAGLKLEKIYSIPGKKIFTAGDPRAYIISKKD